MPFTPHLTPLTPAPLTPADLTPADLTPADLTPADLTPADLTAADIATGDSTPAGRPHADIARAPHHRTAFLASDVGQATVEYALVLLGAALIALLLIGWATVGGGATRISQFLGHVFDVIERKVV